MIDGALAVLHIHTTWRLRFLTDVDPCVNRFLQVVSIAIEHIIVTGAAEDNKLPADAALGFQRRHRVQSLSELQRHY